MWLPSAAIFLLKAARRADAGFRWVNDHLNIKSEPVHCIGFVVGALLAILYWIGAVIYLIA